MSVVPFDFYFFFLAYSFLTHVCLRNSNMDMIQAIGWNSIERTSSDWERLFKTVDSRLKFLGTRTPPGCSVSLIEAQFEGEATTTTITRDE